MCSSVLTIIGSPLIILVLGFNLICARAYSYASELRCDASTPR